MGTCYYIVQRTGHVRLALGKLALFTFWGWQLACVLAMATMPFGITQSKEYAEPEWFIDLLIAVVWVAFGVVFFTTLTRRRIRHIYVANWYYGALIIAVALLHIVNNLALPVSLTKSYPIYSGAVDAMVQWWYGHNAVAFFLTAGFLGMMYYFVPRQAQQPLWSYRFSIVNFWALISDLHVGRLASPAVHRAAGLGAVGGHGVLGGAGHAEHGLGRQRPDDVQRLVGQIAHRPRRQVHDHRAGVLRDLDAGRFDRWR